MTHICPDCEKPSPVETAVVQMDEQTKVATFVHRLCWFSRQKPV